jgi:hypothetical protein
LSFLGAGISAGSIGDDCVAGAPARSRASKDQPARNGIPLRGAKHAGDMTIVV